MYTKIKAENWKRSILNTVISGETIHRLKKPSQNNESFKEKNKQQMTLELLDFTTVAH